LIDVPGHHAFLRNMLAGAGGIDCVMLVIAADEGVKAQTEEHLVICALLGIEHGLVALTKIDAVDNSHLARTRHSVSTFLKGTFLEAAPIVAVSARNGAGLSEFRNELARVAAQVPPRSMEFVPRLPLDRSFSVRGFGTVVTGTLQAGCLRAGQTLEQHPFGRQLRVRGLQVHGASRDHAQAPCRVALNLAGIEVAQIGRGDMLTPPSMLVPTRMVDVELNLLRDAPALKHGSRLRVHAFTADTVAKVLLFDSKDHPESAPNLARLKLEKPMLLVPGDRLILRQNSPAATIGGARVLDAAPVPKIRKAATAAWLQSLRRASQAEQLGLRVGRRGADGLALSTLVSETGRMPEALQARIAPLVAIGRLIACAPQGAAAHWISREALDRAMQGTEQELHRAGSLSRAELRSKTGLNPSVFELVLERLAATRSFEVSGELVRRAGSGDQIPERKQRQLHAVEEVYVNAGLAAPLLSDVAGRLGITPAETRELITTLLRSKRLVRLGADNALVHPGALEKLYADLRKHRGESFDVGRFKSLTGLTRKHAIPLLEHLDSVRVTRNDKGTRIVL
jgi:selenocysteine-specific elongation factor